MKKDDSSTIPKRKRTGKKKTASCAPSSMKKKKTQPDKINSLNSGEGWKEKTTWILNERDSREGGERYF